MSIEQARVHWIKKTLETLESGEITIENPLMSQTSHSHTQVGLFFSLSPLPIHAIEYLLYH
jgi:hypothetical protein